MVKKKATQKANVSPEGVRKKLYFVTQDLRFLMRAWCLDPRHNFRKAPDDAFFDKLQESLKKNLSQNAFATAPKEKDKDGKESEFGIDVRYVTAAELPSLRRTNFIDEFWITLDTVYVPKSDAQVDICRIFWGPDKISRGPREGEVHLDGQCDGIIKKYCDSKKKKVVLADDGTYSGNSVVEILKALRKKKGISVDEIRLGLCTVKSFGAIGQCALEEGLPAMVYQPSIVVGDLFVHDWICERDFYLGVPRSGRTYGTESSPGMAYPHKECSLGRPYVYPFGDPKDAAGITDFEKFSRQQILDSMMLWREIETLNGKILKVRDVPRFPGLSPKDYLAYQEMDWIQYICDEAHCFSNLRSELDVC